MCRSDRAEARKEVSEDVGVLRGGATRRGGLRVLEHRVVVDGAALHVHGGLALDVDVTVRGVVRVHHNWIVIRREAGASVAPATLEQLLFLARANGPVRSNVLFSSTPPTRMGPCAMVPSAIISASEDSMNWGPLPPCWLDQHSSGAGSAPSSRATDRGKFL